MLAEISAVMWKEWRQFLQRAGGNFSVFVLRMGLFFAIFASVIPANIEDGEIMGGYWGQIWISVPSIIVMGLIPFSFAGERETRTLPTLLATPLSNGALILGKMGLPVIYGLICGVVISVCLLFKVNILSDRSELVLYTPQSFISGVLTCLLVAILLSTIGIYHSMRAATIRQAQTSIVLTIFLLFFLPTILFSILIVAIGLIIPDEIKQNIVAYTQLLSPLATNALFLLGFAILDAVLITLLIKWFKRDKLMTVN